MKTSFLTCFSFMRRVLTVGFVVSLCLLGGTTNGMADVYLNDVTNDTAYDSVGTIFYTGSTNQRELQGNITGTTRLEATFPNGTSNACRLSLTGDGNNFSGESPSPAARCVRTRQTALVPGRSRSTMPSL